MKWLAASGSLAAFTVLGYAVHERVGVAVTDLIKALL